MSAMSRSRPGPGGACVLDEIADDLALRCSAAAAYFVGAGLNAVMRERSRQGLTEVRERSTS